MSWEGSDRRSRLPSDWPARVAAVRARAGGICEQIKSSGRRCTNAGRDVDHVVRGDDHDLSNLRLLCKWHHGQKSSAEGLEARTAKKAQALRPQERHPGARK